MIEEALTTNGYRIETYRQHRAHHTTARVVTRGLTTVLLIDAPHQAWATIDIWGLGQAAAAQLVESLSCAVRKHTPE